MTEPLCLLTIHAHPDDESSKGAGTVARYHAEGVHTVLVCCTGGEEGDILNPALDTPEVRERLPELRREELAAATDIIGYDEVELLGYRDSGMAESPSNANPECFAQAPIEEAVGRLVAIIRRTKPQVIVTYGDEQSGYPHPDHLRVHDISVPAFEAAGDPSKYPEAGPPWQPSKLYYTMFSMRRLEEVHEKFLELGLESPFDETWRDRWKGAAEQPLTTSIDIAGYGDVRGRALLAHATQVDPNSKMWFGLPPEVMATIHPHDDYQLARSTLGLGPDGPGGPGSDAEPWEDDLFAGLRDSVAR